MCVLCIRVCDRDRASVVVPALCNMDTNVAVWLDLPCVRACCSIALLFCRNRPVIHGCLVDGKCVSGRLCLCDYCIAVLFISVRTCVLRTSYFPDTLPTSERVCTIASDSAVSHVACPACACVCVCVMVEMLCFSVCCAGACEYDIIGISTQVFDALRCAGRRCDAVNMANC